MHIRIGLWALCAALVTFIFADEAFAQTIIEPGPPGTINNVVLGDTTAAGERNTCHYVLRRDAVYIYNQRMSMRDASCVWIFEAEEGSGARPIIRPAALPGGEESPRPFHLFAKTTLILQDLYIDGYDTSLPDPGRPGDNATIRAGADSARFIIDNVRIDRNRQSSMRTDNVGTKWYITNSQFTNLYNDTRPDQSYVFDTRGNAADSVVFINNSIWNHTGQIVNNPNAEFNYIKFDHNTFLNIGGVPNEPARLDTLRIEEPGEDDFGVISVHQANQVVFRNNLLVNAGVIGTETNDVFVPRFVVDIDSTLIEVDSVTFAMNPPAGVDIRNNVISWDENIETGYPDTIRAFTQEDFYDPTLDLFIEAQGSAETLLSTNVQLNDAPSVPPSFVTNFYEFATGAREREVLFFPRDTRTPAGEGNIDLGYSTTSEAYTAAEDGLPAGDLNWFGMAEGYESGPDNFATIGTSAEDEGGLPTVFKLHGNYPNPFNPATTIRFDLAVAAEVSVEVIDMLGRQVLAMPARTMQAGTQQNVRVDARGLASGVYIYRVSAKTQGTTQYETGKMILMK